MPAMTAEPANIAIAPQHPSLPEPIDHATASELRRSFCESLGFDPSSVTRIEFNAYAISVWTFDKATRNSSQLVMDTRNKTTTPWTVKRSTYSHAPAVKAAEQ